MNFLAFAAVGVGLLLPGLLRAQTEPGCPELPPEGTVESAPAKGEVPRAQPADTTLTVHTRETDFTTGQPDPNGRAVSARKTGQDQRESAQLHQDGARQGLSNGADSGQLGSERNRISGIIRNLPPVAGVTRTTAKSTYYRDPPKASPSTVNQANTSHVPAYSGTDPWLKTFRQAAVQKSQHYLYAQIDLQTQRASAASAPSVGLSKPALLFDARDGDQVAFARRTIDSVGKFNIVPVLVGGSPYALECNWKIPVRFDSEGATYVKPLGIQHVPAIVQAEGQRIRIDEVLP
jgi:hypothetical protein